MSTEDKENLVEKGFENRVSDIAKEAGTTGIKITTKQIIIAAAIFVVISAAIVIPIVIVATKKEKDEPVEPPYDPVPKEEDLAFTEEEHRLLSRKLATEGMVLAKNVFLPIEEKDQVVLFGLGTEKTYYGGTGSGEVYEKGTSTDITPIKILEGIENKYKEKKFHYKNNTKGYEITEGGLTDEDIKDFATLEEGATRSVAILTISRFSGEGSDRTQDSGERGTLLTDAEKNTFNSLIKYFDHIVLVLNVGSVMEISDLVKNEKTSVLIAFLPGMEAGNAIGDVLVGDANPSGHLTDTWAEKIDDYPTTATFKENIEYVKYKEGLFVGYRYFEDDEEKQKKVVFPFGFGLTYTSFNYTKECVFENDVFKITSVVTNTGKRPGKEVIQIYAEKPQNDKFIKVKRELVGFDKTNELKPGESQTISIWIRLESLASYDDTGVTGNKACYVLEKGDYNLYIGESVADTRGDKNKIFTYNMKELKVTQKLSTRLQPKDPDVKDANTKPNFEEIMKVNYESKDNNLNKEEESDTSSSHLSSSSDYTVYNLTAEESQEQRTIPTDKISEINFKTVLQRKHKMEDLVNIMSNEEIAFLTYGHTAKIKSGTGIIGGNYNSDILGKYLIPSGDTNDGPAGIRQAEVFLQSAAWPCSTLLASTFDINVMEKVGNETGKEARRLNTTFWLAPGMNIHRSPLCGRNFEYYSEDPFLTGHMAAAISKGLQNKRVSITIKHFAFNDKEENRNGDKSETGLASDSRVAERVAREIYLKGFEIAVKDGKAWSLMTSYNRVNGMKTAESYDLLTGILRNEWGFDGLVMTDWGTNSKIEREIHGGGNVKMPNNADGSTSVLNALKNGIITRDDLKRTALHILNTLGRTAAIDRLFRDPLPIYLNETKKIKIYGNIYNKFASISYEKCNDTDGGYNPTYTKDNTWLTLFVNNEEEGYRRARIRFSSTLPGFGVIVKRYEETLGEITNLESTGDWQKWQTSPDFSIYLPKGTYELTLLFVGYDYKEVQTEKGNINWIEIDKKE
ncbi:MAG: glycoside hydrolase family 3 C-terminal domain-containing protein [archaeon]|nr:glycoside hydrolase family 3 C-terminal domain-containing protein [archaeon]